MTIEPLHLKVIQPGLRTRIDLFFAEKGQGFNAASYTRARLPSILRLDAMSDSELTNFGLTRDGILPFVFEDCFADPEPAKRRPMA
ncbi:hypothetical protein [Marivita sp. XM-24bin2]|jgi:hypothetical protein|uniref:hypothetical protein n=1 Tax=unclassified Marivita TaxID=2632480 RepID=UPI000D78D937|nr:hypothetical protein [Marivita sp. XM-24bin2]MCR9107256.1 hypothetical protein [Paracoccaceae bacterium]PWL36616.1 MAG: hypothetical protein DCO97_03835 [Marivita sp. XM-24bin2]